MDEQAVRETMASICDAAAEAVVAYSQIARADPVVGSMPEYFVNSMVLVKVGRRFADRGIGLELEVPFKRLREYDAATRGSPSGSGNPAREQGSTKADTPLSRIVDLVVSEYKPSGEPLRVLALVEFKYGLGPSLLRDRKKLQGILSEMDTCRWGIYCGIVGHDAEAVASQGWIDGEKDRALNRGDLWCIKPVDPLPVAGKYPEYSICAIGFQRQPATLAQ